MIITTVNMQRVQIRRYKGREWCNTEMSTQCWDVHANEFWICIGHEVVSTTKCNHVLSPHASFATLLKMYSFLVAQLHRGKMWRTSSHVSSRQQLYCYHYYFCIRHL